MACLLLAAALGCFLEPSATSGPAAGASVYGGVGSWVDIFAKAARRQPEQVVAALRARGVTTLYLQTSNYSHPQAVVGPGTAGRFVDTAHAAGIRVVAWYLPSLASPQRDLAHVLGALRFRTASGQRFDSVALDIEASLVHPIALRNARLLALAASLRRAAGDHYPLGAIIPSPVGMARHPSYWPGFPYTQLASVFDAFVPMAYFSYYTNTATGAYDYATRTVATIRKQTGWPDVAIQLIGGIANEISPAALSGFTRAAADCGIAGISLYAYSETSAAQWTQLDATPIGTTPSSTCAG
jgi:hypothetical protein